jgi:hypothetical protein
MTSATISAKNPMKSWCGDRNRIHRFLGIFSCEFFKNFQNVPGFVPVAVDIDSKLLPVDADQELKARTPAPNGRPSGSCSLAATRSDVDNHQG